MRPPHDPPRRRRTAPAVTLTALAAALLLLPGTALASSVTSASCDDPLVTYTRDGADGDRAAVALTAQSIERGVDGWEHVTWSAASGTILTGVLATDADGTVTALDASATGTANGVVALTFCGSTEPLTLSTTEPAEAVVAPEPADPDADTGTDGGAEDDTADEAADADGGEPADDEAAEDEDVSIHIEFEPEAIIDLEDGSADGDTGTEDGSAGADDSATDDGASDDGASDDGVSRDESRSDDVEVAPVDGDEGTSPSSPHSGNEATSGDGETADPDAEAAETEVLGVTIVAEAEATDAADGSEAGDATADPLVAQAATSNSAGSATPLLPVSVRILLALAAALAIAAAIRAARSTEVAR